MPAETKALAVYSGGRWVAAAGGAGGTVDLSGLVTKPEFVDAVQDLNAQLANRYTRDQVDDLFAALPPQVPPAIELHDEAAPDFGPGLTPAGAVAAVSPYEDGLHWFTTSSVLLLVSRKPLPNGEELRLQSFSPAATAVGRLSNFVPPPGSVGTPPSWFVRQEGQVFFRLEAALPDDQFVPVGRGDVLESVTQQQLTDAIANVQVGTLTQEQVQAIVEAVVANGFDLSDYYDKTEVDAIAKLATDQAAIWDQELRDQTFGELQLVLTSIGNSLALKGDKTALDAAVADIAALASQQQTFLTQSDIDQTNQLLQGLATATQDCLSGLETKADKTTVSSLGTTLMNSIMEVKDSSDAAIGLKADKSDTYTKVESDGKYLLQTDLTGTNVVAALVGQDLYVDSLHLGQTAINFGDESAIASGGGRLLYAADVGDPSKLETVAFSSDLAGYAPLSTTTLITTQLQAVFDSIYTRAESDDRYAKKQDNTQAILAKTLVAQAVGFGDTALPPAALTYTDTGEGFGPRLVFAVGMVNDYVALRSDFEPIAARVQAMEDRAVAPTTFDPNLYWRKDICDARYMLKGDGMSKVDFDNQMALSLYSRSQIDAKLVAISPVGAATINDPALADFKKSVLDEVKKMLAGGTKMPPPDIDWTWMIRMDGSRESVSTEIQARMIGGFIELKGTLSFGAGSGSWVPLRLPPQFPLAEIDANYPLAMRLVGSAVTYGFCSVSSKSRDVSCSPGARSNEANFSGIRFKADY